MKDIPYVNRYTPCLDASLSELVTEIISVPYNSRRPDGFMFISGDGLPRSDGPYRPHYAKPTPALESYIAKRSIWSLGFETFDENGIGEYHSLELVQRESGLLLYATVKGVSGSYAVSYVLPEDVMAMASAKEGN